MLIGMEARDRLIAVSNWDAERAEIAGLPRVGDYRNLDWEKLGALRPDVLVAQFAPDKMPPGLRERAEALNIKLVNIRIVRLDDIFGSIRDIGAAAGTADAAGELERSLRERLDRVKRAVEGNRPVRTLIVRDSGRFDTVGGGNFLDDVLTIAGGQNVLAGGENSFPTIDKEQLVALDPEVVIHLLPSASAQVREQVRRDWDSMPNLRAVRGKRVHLLDEFYMLLPSHRMADAADRFAKLLHDVDVVETEARP